MSTDTQVLTEILSTLKGLSPPPILSTMSKSLDKLNSNFDTLNSNFTKFTDNFTKFNDNFTKFNDNFTTFTTSVNKDSKKAEGFDIANIVLGVASLGVGVGGLFKGGADKMGSPKVGIPNIDTAKIGTAIKNITKMSGTAIKGIAQMGVAIMGTALMKMASMATKISVSLLPAIGTIGTVIATYARLGLSATMAGLKMAAAWLVGLGPIALVIAAIVGVFALIIFNIDHIKNAWTSLINKFSDLPNLDKFLEPVTKTITWILDKIDQIKSLAGGFVNKIFNKNTTDKIAPQKPANTLGISNNDKAVLPSLSPNIDKHAVHIPTAIANNHQLYKESISSSQSTHNNQTVYNIANIDIADGVISDMEDLIQYIKYHSLSA
ncbi:MAG: hypothetical protein KFW21_05950 [Spirochaetota bacterium]|nr:hypothetical protein [Spirochaetota bacterium]